MRLTLFFAVATLLSVLSVAPLHAATVLAITDLGAGVKPDAINNSGQVVGQNATGTAFLWTAGVMTNLGTLGGSQSYANDINDSGAIVGWSHVTGDVMKAFKYEGSMANLDDDWAFASSAESINANGDVVGWRTNGTQYGSVYWGATESEGQFYFTDYTGNQKAIGINNNNEVVGLLVDGTGVGVNSYYWTGSGNSGEFTSILNLGFLATAGLNNLSIIAGSKGSFSAYMDSDDNVATIMTKLPPQIPSSVSRAFGINDLGNIVGQSGLNGYIFDITTGILLNANDFAFVGFMPNSLLRITDINNDGTIIGIALVDGVEHGFFAQFAEGPTSNPAVPEPSSVVLFALGLTVLGCVKRRRRTQLA